MAWNRNAVSACDRLEVGSSMMRMRASTERAFAISTICWRPMVSVLKMVPGSVSRPTIFKKRRVSDWMWARSMNPFQCGSRPRKMFAPTSRLVARLSSWWIIAMPISRAARGDSTCIGTPSSSNSPSSGGWMPERILDNVLLPAPFSPINASTSPVCSWRETSRRA